MEYKYPPDLIRRMLLNGIARSLKEEMKRDTTKFPRWPEDQIHAAAIVAEEAGELLQATLQCKYENGSIEKVRKEAIQTAAMAIRFLGNLLYSQIKELEEGIDGKR